MRRFFDILRCASIILCFSIGVGVAFAQNNPMRVVPPAQEASPSQSVEKNDAQLAAYIQQNVPFDDRVMMQGALIMTGHFIGTANGEINAATIRAIRSFQKAQGYDQTGEWTDDLRGPLAREAAYVAEWSGYADSKPILRASASLPFNLLLPEKEVE